jgi:hypothetical protein
MQQLTKVKIVLTALEIMIAGFFFGVSAEFGRIMLIKLLT